MHPTGAYTPIENSDRAAITTLPSAIAHLDAAHGKGSDFTSAPSPSRSRNPQGVRTGNATVSKKPDSSSVGLIVGIIVAVFAVIVLLLVFFRWFENRRRTVRKTRSTDQENGTFRLAPFESTRDTIKSTADLGDTNSSRTLSVSQKTFSTPLSSDEQYEYKVEKSLPIPPPRLDLRPVSDNRKAQQGDSFTTASPSTIKSQGRFSVAHSVLTNPWDGDGEPGSAGFERMMFELPAFPPPSALPMSSFKVGLPQRPSMPPARLPPEMKPPSSWREPAVKKARPRTALV
ncbi:hypothetical protein BGW80DRAFT_1448602 [Lactifluus volemus]|nr:hypothetical protein BGW80DRAFT_1448602 [Lactifluus volemus]